MNFSEASGGAPGRRDTTSHIALYVAAGSVTALTLGTTAYLLLLRRQHSRLDGNETDAGDPSANLYYDFHAPCLATSQVGRAANAASPRPPHQQAPAVANNATRPPNRTALTFDWFFSGFRDLWRASTAAHAAPVARSARTPSTSTSAEGRDTAVRQPNQNGELRLDPDTRGLAAAGAGGVVAPPVLAGDVVAGADEDLPVQEQDGPDTDALSVEDAAGGADWRALLDENEDDDLDVPDDYKDPISLNVMLDPVVLCATGQVYEYSSIKNWFRTGNRLCPKTNIEVLDVQVVRLPWLKARIHEWLRQHGRAPAPPPDPIDRLASLHPLVASWVNAVRNDTGERRSSALADLYEILRQWEGATEAREGQEAMAAAGVSHAAYAAAMEKLHRYVRGAVMEESIWLLRHGNPYLQGVAASILAYCDTPGEVSWLAATAAVPAVSLCMSQNRYTSQAATRLLYNLARGGQMARRALVGAGAVTALISVLATDRLEYGYCRDRAAATLALLIRDADGKSLLLRYGLPHLVAMVRSGLDRWEQRDAATVLLKLGLAPEDLLRLGLTPDLLISYWCCSRAWLEGAVDDPTKGYQAAETQARNAVLRLQAGTLTHAALAGFIADQDADLDLANPLEEAHDPWDESEASGEEAIAAWRAVEASARGQLDEAAEKGKAERQAAEERRRRESAGGGEMAGEAAAAGEEEEGAEEEEEEEGDEGMEEEEQGAQEEGGSEAAEDGLEGLAAVGEGQDSEGDVDGVDVPMHGPSIVGEQDAINAGGHLDGAEEEDEEAGEVDQQEEEGEWGQGEARQGSMQ